MGCNTICVGLGFHFTFIVHVKQQKFVFNLLKDVCSDFIDTNCITISSPSSLKPPMLSTDGMSSQAHSHHISLLSYMTTVKTTILVPVLL